MRGPMSTRSAASFSTSWPAPSRSALAWLESSIRSYAKFLDTAARVLAGGQDEGEDVRRERSAQHEIERLLTQMSSVQS